jgi:hypothetical protein
MEQTAMKDMVDYLQELMDKTTDESESYMLIAIWVHAVYLLDKEKNQTEKAYSDGVNDARNNSVKYKYYKKDQH